MSKRKSFYHVEDSRGVRSGFYLSSNVRSLLASLGRKDGMAVCGEGRLFTALRYKITRAKVVNL